jgi:hypothetical protein
VSGRRFLDHRDSWYSGCELDLPHRCPLLADARNRAVVSASRLPGAYFELGRRARKVDTEAQLLAASPEAVFEESQEERQDQSAASMEG